MILVVAVTKAFQISTPKVSMHIALRQRLCYNVAYDIRMSLLPRRNQSALCAFGKFLWVRAYKVLDLRTGISLHADGDENGRQASMGTLQVRSLLRPPHAGLNCLIAWGGSIRYYLYYRLLDHMILAACASRHQRANKPFTTVSWGLSPTVPTVISRHSPVFSCSLWLNIILNAV